MAPPRIMKPVVKVWCLPESTEKKLNLVFEDIVDAIKEIPEIGVQDQNSLVVLFPTDMMKYGLGTEIVVEATCLFEKSDREELVARDHLAKNLGEVLKGHFPKAIVQCIVAPLDPERRGYWISPRMGRRHKPSPQEIADLTGAK